MNRHKLQRTAWWVLVVMIGASLTLSAVFKRDFTGDDLLFLVWVLYAPVGAVVARRRPDNPIGWVFLLVGLAASLLELSVVGVQAALVAGPPLKWWGFASAWAESGLTFPLLILATSFTFLLYPSGLLSPRWRPVLWLVITLSVLSFGFSMLSATLWIGEEGAPNAYEVVNPVALSSPGFLNNSYLFWVAALFALTLMSVVSALLRAWRAKGIERLQMRFFAASILLLLLSLAPAQWLAENGYSFLRFVLLAAAFACIPLSCGVAILRYRLYDIDRIIGRTTAYVLVTGVLLGVYVAVVTSLTSLVPESGSTGQADSWAVAVATLVAAGLFRPVLRWARRVVDRRFNREQFDAERAVEAFAVRLRDEVEGDEVRSDLLTVLGSTVQPASAGLWLKEPAP